MKRSSTCLVIFALAAGPLTTIACGESNPDANTPKPESSASTSASSVVVTVESATASASAVPTTPPAPALPAVVVDDMPASDDPKPLPTAKITAPTNESSVGDASKAKDYVVKVDVKNWKLEAGQHVHVILDDNPYFRYEGKTPLKLGDLLPKDADIAEGQHVIHAFPSRPSHESVKGKGASSMVVFWVGKKDKKATPIVDPKKPHLVYSRPKGANPGAMGKNLLLDFYLMGTDLSDGYKVRYTVMGPGTDTPLTGMFDKWAPKVVHNARKGDYAVKLELLDKDGKLMDGKLNSVERKVSVDPDAPDAMMMAPAPVSSAK
jgi:hypothetical protein